MGTLNRLLNLVRMLPPALSAALPGIGPMMARRRFPTVSGTLAAKGLSAPVEIVRDKWGVPHIYATNDHDLFFAQGFVHAQDRLFQMELGRRIGEGTLSALVGPAGLPADRYVRTLGLRRIAESALSKVGAEDLAILEAYAEGVNARIQSGEALPLEFSILGVAPLPWTPAATLVRGNMLALALGGNHRLELLRAQMLSELGEAITADLLPPHAPDSPLIVGLRDKAALEGLDGVDDVLGDPNIVSGSNNWVVHGSLCAEGKPLLANDVHIGLAVPSIWYENGLHGGRFEGVGFSLAGVPLIVIGHNGRVAWGMSNLGPDTQDFYIEKLDDPTKPTRYEFMGEWHELSIVREEIPVRGERPIELEIRSTRHGPIMNEAMSRVLKDAEPMALRWALGESAPLITALSRINLACSVDEFREALMLWESPGQNFVFADVEGNIGYQATGKIPIRAPGHDGSSPVPGFGGEYEWKGFIPFDELPWSKNPEAGFVATANNKPTSDDYPHLLASNWFPGYRAKRITDLLRASSRHTVGDMRRIQGETYSLPAEALRPYFVAIEIEPRGELEKQALAELEAWDLRFEVDRVGATIFQAYYICLLRRILGHKLGPELSERYLACEYERHGSMHMPLVIALMAEPESSWFDDPKTPGQTRRDDILRLAFADAIDWLRKKYGPDPKAWAWGKVHTLTYFHSPLGRNGPSWLRRLFNTRTIPARGDNYSVNGASFIWKDPFTVVHGTAMRMIIDLGDFSRSVGVHAPGQSEHVGHPHREDLMMLCQELGDHPLLWTREAVMAQAESTLRLEPRR